MDDGGCVPFLQAILPELGLRWPGFRRVRRQVCRRIRRRWTELGLEGWETYRRFVLEHSEEWEVLETLCRVTISRFGRDRGVWECLGGEVLPLLAAGSHHGRLSAWSAGCASGEEPYTLSILWLCELAERFPDTRLEILATECDPHLLSRARRAVYPPGCLHELPGRWIAAAFEPAAGGELRLRPAYRRGVLLRRQDLRRRMPKGPFHLVLCRNLAFTYFAEDVQRQVLAGIGRRLVPGGVLVLGSHEALPAGVEGFAPWPGERRIVRKLGADPDPPRPGTRKLSVRSRC